MKYFLLKPSFITAKIVETYEYITDQLERDGHTVYNPLCTKTRNQLKLDYDTDCEIHCRYVDKMPRYDEYCLLRYMMFLTNYDVLIVPENMSHASELALYHYARTIGMSIKEIKV